MALRIVIDQPAEQCFGANDVFIGPTAVDLSPVTDAAERAARERAIQAEIRRREAGLFKQWRGQDFATHTFQQKRRHWRKAD